MFDTLVGAWVGARHERLHCIHEGMQAACPLAPLAKLHWLNVRLQSFAHMVVAVAAPPNAQIEAAKATPASIHFMVASLAIFFIYNGRIRRIWSLSASSARAVN